MNAKEQISLFDNIFIEQAEYIKDEAFIKWSATHPNEENIIKKLSQSGAKVITGPRGCGKTTLMLKVYNRLLVKRGKIAFPIYVNFKFSLKMEPLYHTKSNATYWFTQWLLLKIYIGFLESLKKLKVTVMNNLFLEKDVNKIIRQIEIGDIESIDTSKVLTVELLEMHIKEILEQLNKTHCVLLLDDAAHAFSTEQQKDFFDLFRQLKSRFISPKAAIYPGITVYSSSFHVGHDAEEIDVWLKPEDKGYLEFMIALLQNRLSDENFMLLIGDIELLNILCFSCFGIPRALINMIQSIFSADENYDVFSKSNYNIANVKKAVKESFSRTENIFLSLKVKLPVYLNFIERGKIVFDNMVEGLKTYNKGKESDKQAVVVAVKHPIPKELEKVFSFLQYAGLIMYRQKLNKGEKGVFDLYTVHYGALIERNAFIGKQNISVGELALSLQKRSSQEFKRTTADNLVGSSDYGTVFTFSLPNCPKCDTPRASENAKFCLECGAQLKSASLYQGLINNDIAELQLTKSRIQNIKNESSIRTIKDILMDNGGVELRKVNMIGEIWAQRIMALTEEYLV